MAIFISSGHPGVMYRSTILHLHSKRDYLAFECAMKEEGQVRLHTGGYSVCRYSTGL